MLLDGNFFVTKQDKASKDTFFLIHLIFQSNLSLKVCHQKFENVTWGEGVRKMPKKCQVIFEWPLTCRKTKIPKQQFYDLNNCNFLKSCHSVSFSESNILTWYIFLSQKKTMFLSVSTDTCRYIVGSVESTVSSSQQVMLSRYGAQP
jgi:hypothetical protein